MINGYIDTNTRAILEDYSMNMVYHALTEAYKGKSEMKECEKLCNEIVRKVKEQTTDNGFAKLGKRYDITTSEENKRLEAELARIFKVSKIRIYWPVGGFNAFTLPPFTLFTLQARDIYLNNKDAVSFLRINICVYEDLITTGDLTGAEILAIILHEIGHNFYMCPLIAINHSLLYIFSCAPILAMYAGVHASRITDPVVKKIFGNLYTIVDNFDKLIGQVNSRFGLVINISEEIFKKRLKIYRINLFESIVNTLTRLASKLCIPVSVLINNIFNISTMANYGNEKGADSLAASYGYSIELASGLRKFRSPKQNDVFTNILKRSNSKPLQQLDVLFHDIMALYSDIIAQFVNFDEHPNANQRGYAMLHKLESDLKNGDYPPEYKKELEKEIQGMKEYLKQINSYDIYGNDTIKISQTVYDTINEITDGHSDIREFLNFYWDLFRF